MTGAWPPAGKQFGILAGEAMLVAASSSWDSLCESRTAARAVLHQGLGRVIIQQVVTALGTWLIWNKDTSLDFAALFGESVAQRDPLPDAWCPLPGTVSSACHRHCLRREQWDYPNLFVLLCLCDQLGSMWKLGLSHGVEIQQLPSLCVSFSHRLGPCVLPLFEGSLSGTGMAVGLIPDSSAGSLVFIRFAFDCALCNRPSGPEAMLRVSSMSIYVCHQYEVVFYFWMVSLKLIESQELVTIVFLKILGMRIHVTGKNLMLNWFE